MPATMQWPASFVKIVKIPKVKKQQKRENFTFLLPISSKSPDF
jgi:hypothetical protein